MLYVSGVFVSVFLFSITVSQFVFHYSPVNQSFAAYECLLRIYHSKFFSSYLK